MQEQLFKAIYDMNYVWLKMKKAAAELLAARGFGVPLKASPFRLQTSTFSDHRIDCWFRSAQLSFKEIRLCYCGCRCCRFYHFYRFRCFCDVDNEENEYQ
eukprot:s3606_g3.t1